MIVLLISIWVLHLSRQTMDTLHGKDYLPGWVKGIPHYGVMAALLIAGWILVGLNGWESHALNWLNLLVRWAHVIIGIAWIGASFYFVFLENSLNRTVNVREELAGNLWAIHGGGFYYLEKYKLAPKEMPRKLHWFKYEAYFTWITGFLLLVIVYYSKASFTMIGNLAISPTLAILIGIGSLVLGWLGYDLLCRTMFTKKPLLFFVILLLFTILISFILTEFLSPKAAYIHIGAMLGTMMAGNVFMVIIPSQKALVSAAKKGLSPDPRLGQHASLRSLHNNYFTLPVVFIMISNHFPSTFGHPYNWAVLGGLIVVSTGIRHYLNLQEKGQQAFWILPLATLGIMVLAFVTAPNNKSDLTETKVEFREVMAIFQSRCNTCHSENPTDKIWVVPPDGVVFDQPSQIVQMQDQIMLRVVTTEHMPLANQTSMTTEERELIKHWILQGSQIE